jgi:hypothetical protein
MNPAFPWSPFDPGFSPVLEKVGEMLHSTVNATDTREEGAEYPASRTEAPSVRLVSDSGQDSLADDW